MCNERLWVRSVMAASVVMLGLLRAALAQVGTDAPLSAPVGGQNPVHTVAGSGKPAMAETPGSIRDEGLARSTPILAIDDAIPLPDSAVVIPGETADEVLAPASGDPYFLGFAAGRYRPPADERLDPDFGDAISRLGIDRRPREEVYGFIMLKKRLTESRLAEIEALGVRVLGAHPHASLRAAMPVEALPALAALDAVRWVGVAERWQKVHPHLLGRMATAGAETIRVYISVFESDLGDASTAQAGVAPTLGGPDGVIQIGTALPASRGWMSNGWMQRALEREGVLLREYVPQHNVFRAEATVAQIERLLAFDFVQFVEAEVEMRFQHEESMPMIHADVTRVAYDGNTTERAVAGIVDTGVNVSHSMLNHIWWLQWNESTSSSGGNVDLCGHGSHVAGTILGEPASTVAELRGVAPELATFPTGRFRIVKIGDDLCNLGFSDLATVFSHFRSTWVNGNDTSNAPVVINNSWGSDPGTWFGSEYEARVADDEVFTQDQVYVFSAGNDGPGASTIGLPGVAKNVLTVGSVRDFQSSTEDPGEISMFSSRGPCADGRWKPNVVAPGEAITSAKSSNTTQYTDKNGTSMAAPHVTGLVAQLADHHDGFTYNPARMMSLVQATATTRNNVALGSEQDAHLDNFGCGRVNAYKAHYTTSQIATLNWWYVWGGVIPPWFSGDFTVPPGTTRVVVCMTYVEPSVSPGASKALINDWDLYIDQNPIDGNGNTGEWIAQQSNVDNTEIRTLDAPVSGPWRWKAWPTFHSPGSTIKMSVTVQLYFGDTTPNGTLSLAVDSPAVKPDADVSVTATLTADSHIASAVLLDSTPPTFASLKKAQTILGDGITTDLLSNVKFGTDMMLGDMVHGSSRVAKWTLSIPSEGVWPFPVNVRSDNMDDLSATAYITVDGTPPAVPTGLQSTTHAPGSWYSQGNIAFQWQAAVDNLSGVMGYSYAVAAGSPFPPSQTLALGSITSFSQNFASSASGQYLSLRPVDNALNWSGSYASVGPFFIDTVDPPLVGGLTSTTHTPGVWSNNSGIEFKWSAAVDAHSGTDGYSLLIEKTPLGPDLTKDVAEVPNYSVTLASSSSGYYFNVRSVDLANNWDDEFASTGPYFIDTTVPIGPGNLASTSHSVNVWSSNPTISLSWTAATDSFSGLAGYDTVFDTSPSTVPAGSLDESAGSTGKSGTVGASSGTYFHIRPKDVAGNWGTTQHIGPFLIDNAAPPTVTGLTSATHTPTVWSNNPTVTVSWNPVSDGTSGIAGYSFLFDQNAGTLPDSIVDTTTPSGTKLLGASTAPWYFHVRAKDLAGNLGGAAHFGPLLIDNKEPDGPTSASSSSHNIGVLSTNVSITMNWSAATDVYSGLLGYDIEWDHVANTVPAGVVDTAKDLTSKTTLLAASTQDWWFHIRASDGAGNLGGTLHRGPYKIGLCSNLASNAGYGSGKPGSLGIPLLVPLDNPVLGTTSTVELQNAKPGALPILFLGTAPVSLPFDGGQLLVNPLSVISIPVPVPASGKLPLSGPVPLDAGLCGITLYYQVMFTDSGASGYYHLARTAGLARTFGW